MNEMASRETQGRTSPDHATESAPRPPHCGHHCAHCLADFELTQQHTEHLRAELSHERVENRRLWLDARDAMRQTLLDLVPAQRLPVAAAEAEEEAFRRGWEQCRAEMQRRVEELAKVI